MINDEFSLKGKFEYTGRQMAMAEREGLRLNGEPMEIGRPYELKNGDVIGGLEGGKPILWKAGKT